MMICETADWIEGIGRPQITDRLVRLPELIVEATEQQPGEVRLIRSRADQRLAILAFKPEGQRQCVLVSVAYDETDAALLSRGESWLQKLGDVNEDSVLRHSRRSYPSIICYDEDMWIKVQKDPQANLALSPEEAEILRTSHLQDPSRPAFPLFINGRAGSGKSTLLQYLFAECVLRWSAQFSWQSSPQSRPLYFASSSELLKVAKDNVRSLLKANHDHLLAALQIDSSVLNSLDSCFQDSLQFLRSLVGDDAEQRFARAKYVSYAKFRRLWVERFGRERNAVREFGPQISWHVIRGLIKGMSVDALLEKDDYEELPQEERTVSREVYERVYDRVWKAWYEGLYRNGEAWDSQDLVRFLLDNDRCPTSHVSVFCDEAQDFTRLELEALYRCSLFSARQIAFQSVKRVPFVFAGDPFQTLNPTGFRWESVRAAFTERILRSLYRFNSRADIPQLNYQELTFNYRSSMRIVHLCNSIQAVRASLFSHHSLLPQSTWHVGNDSSAPVFFEKGDAQMEAVLKEQSDLFLIVPCEEGEEVEYVANDPYLHTIVQTAEDGTPRNVLSASRAKGLEFHRVALYGWSLREESRQISKRLRSSVREDMSVDERLGLEYFLNNLYVAASRAQRRLFVIDEKGSRDGLWWFVSDQQHLAHTLRDLPKRDTWLANSGLLFGGVPESFKDDRDDPRAIADQFEREGLSKEDSYLLKLASLQFALAGDVAKSHECRAVAELFDGRYREAGDSFKLANLFERAINAYWRGRLYREIADCAQAEPTFAKLPHCRFATFMVGTSPTIRECRTSIEQLLESAMINSHLRLEFRLPLWQESVDEAVKRSLDATGKSDSPLDGPDHGQLADLLTHLVGLGLATDAKQRARLLIASGRDSDALVLLKDDGTDFYRDVNARVLIGQTKLPNHQLSVGETRIIAEYYFRHEDFEAAARQFGILRDSNLLLECLRHSIKKSSQHAIDAILKAVLNSLLANSEWEVLIALLKQGEPGVGKQGKWANGERSAVLDRVRRDRMDFRIVIPVLARSKELSDANGKSQQIVSEYLKDLLVRPGSAAQWQEDLERKVAGAAIERAGKHIDALEFYESWKKSRVSPREREYADRRWVICKLRRAAREGNKKKILQEAEEVMKKYGWGEKDVPDAFPELPEIQDGLDAASPDGSITGNQTGLEVSHELPRVPGGSLTRGSLGRLTYRLIPSKGWINLESDDGLCARVFVRDRKVTSDDVPFAMLDGEFAECNIWGLKIQWISDDAVRFAINQESCDIRVIDEWAAGIEL